MSEQIKAMKETLMAAAQAQMGNLDKVDAKELGEVVDMIKDLEEASYYCEVVKAMEKKEKEEENMTPVANNTYYYTTQMYPSHKPENYDYWRDMDRDMYDRMYYTQPRDSRGRFVPEGPSDYYNGGNREGYNARNYYSGNSGSGNGGTGSSSGGGNNGSYSSGMNGNSNSMGYSTWSFPMEWRDEREGRSPRSRRTYMESKQTHQDPALRNKELERYMKELSEDVVDMISDASPEEKMTMQTKLNELAQKIKNA